jgi:hypothetical protein
MSPLAIAVPGEFTPMFTVTELGGGKFAELATKRLPRPGVTQESCTVRAPACEGWNDQYV